ncbi:unnamed protein product [Cyprideis torosa]|uniref:Uncharacterized protein n=1 Tax=Cyprideis torosa TaxID=163714 RepID=A0A7R8W8E9_9CRUS|nr:unnamed protein product [Cyprideis torosa]CAG0886144.1 unnamed protein product [Cyprideis torosa]
MTHNQTLLDTGTQPFSPFLETPVNGTIVLPIFVILAYVPFLLPWDSIRAHPFLLACHVAGGLITVIAATYCLGQKVQSIIIAIYLSLGFWGLYKALVANNPLQRRLAFALLLSFRCLMLILRTREYGGGHPHALLHAVLQEALPVFGSVIAVLRVPERWYPGTFDYICNSHNIFHR